jgi:hypothetical protein
MGFHISHGAPFLNWKGSGVSHLVLYIDGEMGAEDMQGRVQREQIRSGLSGATFCTLCCEDIDGLAPLNTKEGRDRLIKEIEKIEQTLNIKFDLIIFDKVQALLESGKDMWGQSWEACAPWQRSLTKRRTAQIWLHHTGKQQDNAYGTDRMKWQMTDTALMMSQKVVLHDISFTYEPQKKRGLSDTNFENFAKFHVTLTPKGWETAASSNSTITGESITGKSKVALDLLAQAIKTDGGETGAVDYKIWRDLCYEAADFVTQSTTKENKRQAFGRAVKSLVGLGEVEAWEAGGKTWARIT